jgi:hypothetical protein
MRRAATLTAAAFDASRAAWALLLGEVAVALLLVSSDKLPSTVVRALALFLRF